MSLILDLLFSLTTSDTLIYFVLLIAFIISSILIVNIASLPDTLKPFVKSMDKLIS